jgi:DNA-binding response OmpR family regulator
MPGAVAVVKGGRILVVDDGRDALDRVHANPPDAILLDLMMPGMNGRQFLQALRDDPTYASVSVLIMTAVHGLEVNLASIGASDVVEKPFDVDDLLNKVALAVYRSRDADAPPQPAVVPPMAERVVEPADRGVVLVVEHDRTRLPRRDLLLSERGYTVVSMTRALAQLSRLARALRPRAILLELASDGVQDVVRELRNAKELEPLPLLVFARDAAGSAAFGDVLERAADSDLVSFVDRQI